ncbi:tRNA adenosine(34) deaminase TadA [Pseudomonadota bacterium]
MYKNSNLNSNEYFMQKALEQAKIAYKKQEVPVGAVIVDSKTKKILSSQYNRPIELKDPTAHAEILAIREVCKKVKNYRLNECDLYVTLEPCAMCASAISWARIKNLYFGAYDEKFGVVTSNLKFFNQTYCNHKIKIFPGILKNECSELLTGFFREKR